MQNASSLKYGFGNQKTEESELGRKWEVNSVWLYFQVCCLEGCVSRFLEVLVNIGLYNVMQRDNAGEQLDSWKNFTTYYLLFPYCFGNSLKKCSLILEVSSVNH